MLAVEEQHVALGVFPALEWNYSNLHCGTRNAPNETQVEPQGEPVGECFLLAVAEPVVEPNLLGSIMRLQRGLGALATNRTFLMDVLCENQSSLVRLNEHLL